jgi:hypothetical protein
MTVLPPPNVPVSKNTGLMTVPWYSYLHQNDVTLNGTVSGGTSLATQVTTLQGDVTTLQSQFSSNVWIHIPKTSDETRQSSGALLDDSTLKFPVAANTIYTFKFFVWITNASSTQGSFYDINGPASPTLVRYAINESGDTDATGNFTQLATAFQVDSLYTHALEIFLNIEGFVQNGANAGTVSFRWAQNVSTASNTTVRAGSYVDYRAG